MLAYDVLIFPTSLSSQFIFFIQSRLQMLTQNGSYVGMVLRMSLTLTTEAIEDRHCSL